MTKNIFLKSLVASIPVIIIAQAFFYLTSRSGISVNYLVYIKPFLYSIFFFFVVGFPVYFYFSESKPRLSNMVNVIIILWGIFSLILTFSAFFIYHGLAKDIELSLLNMSIYFLKWFAIGAVLLIFACSLIAIVGKKFFLRTRK